MVDTEERADATEPQTIRAVEWTLEAAGRLHRTVTTLPAPAQGEILVRTIVGAISPGTERSLIQGLSPAVPADAYPYQPGYLNVVEIIESIDRTLIGELGVAILGHRDYALIPYHRFIRIPQGRSNDLALLGVLSADARNAIDLAAVESGEDCLVLGGGILGVLTAWELSLATKGTIRLVETNAARREALESIRFPTAIEIAHDPGRYRFHTVFDCANTADAFATAQSAVRPKGSIVLVADGCQEAYVLTPDFFSKGVYLGKTDSHPDLRGFLNEFFSRHDDTTSLLQATFQEEIRFDEYPQSYLKALLAPVGTQRGLAPRVIYS
jgi:2-desacetyl-2-hydroxyethyl bacteriochlorophyllide A dehydrogenase